MPSIKTHVKEGPQTPSGSLINGLPFMQILKVPASTSRTCNDTLLGALLASASDSEGVPQPVHARARPPSAPCGTQELPLVAPSARRCTAAQSISAQRTETEWRRAEHAHADALCSMRSRLGCPALAQDHGGSAQLDTEPHEKWAKQLAVQNLMKLMLAYPEADHSNAPEGLRNEEPAERGYHCLPALQQGGHLTAKICGQQRHLGGGSGADRRAQEPLGPRW